MPRLYSKPDLGHTYYAGMAVEHRDVRGHGGDRGHGAVTICNADHCPQRAVRRGRCEQHAREQGRTKSAKRGYSAHAAGYDARWERTSKRYLRDHPTCERCPSPSVDVHHRDHLGPSGPRGHDRSNLEALCHLCHAAETRRQQLGTVEFELKPELVDTYVDGFGLRPPPTQG